MQAAAGNSGAMQEPPVRLGFLLFVVGTAFMAGRYDFQLTTLALPQFQATFSLSAAEVAYITAIGKLGSIPAVIAVFMADRIGRKPLFLWSIVGFSAAALMAALSPNAQVLTLSLFLTRLFTMIDELLAVVLLAEAAPAASRAWLLGGLSVAGAMGDGAALMAYAGFGATPDGWRWLYAAGAAPALLTLWWRMKLPESRAFVVARASGAPARPLAVLRQRWRVVACLMLLSFLFWIPLQPALTFPSTHLQNAENWTPAQVSGLIFLAGTFGLLGAVAGGWLADRIGRRPVAAAGSLLAGAGLAVLYFGGEVGVFGPAYAVGLVGWFAASVAIRALVTESVPTEGRATMTGVAEIANALGGVLGVALAGLLAERLGSLGPAVLVLLPVTGLAAMAVFLLRETRGTGLSGDSGAPDAAAAVSPPAKPG